MTAGSDKWIRPLEDNAAGRVVDTPTGRRWEWDAGEDDETGRLLRKLHNEELSIERSGIVPNPKDPKSAHRAKQEQRDTPRSAQAPAPKKRKGRDAGGGFNPYDNPGKSGRR